MSKVQNQSRIAVYGFGSASGFAGGGAAVDGAFLTFTDPAVNEASSTGVVDFLAGVAIKLTTLGNSQTLSAPTQVLPGRKFFAINQTANIYSIAFDGYSVGPGEFREFRWDGGAWCVEPLLDSGLLFKNDLGSVLSNELEILRVG